MTECGHDHFFNGVARYDQQQKIIVYMLECDNCKAQIREVFTDPYIPRPKFKDEDA